MRYSKRWFHAGALTIILMVIWASSLWANRHYDYSQLDRLSNINRKSIELMRKGKHQEALKPAEEALRLAKKIYIDDPDHDTVEVMMQNLAFRYMTLGRYSEAEPLFKQILTTDEQLTGPNDPEVARSLINLARLYTFQGRYDEAERHYKRAFAIYEKIFGPNYPKVLTVMRNLAKLRFAQGQLAEAESLLKRMVEILDKAGPSYPNAAKELERVATLYEKLGKYDEAGKLLVRADRIRERQ